MTDLPFDIDEYTEAIVKASEYMTTTEFDRFYSYSQADDLSKAAGARALYHYLNPNQNPQENIKYLLEFAEKMGIHLGSYRFVYKEHGDKNSEVICPAHEFSWGTEVVSCHAIK